MTDSQETPPSGQISWSHNLASLHPKLYAEIRAYYFAPERTMMLWLLILGMILPLTLAINRTFPAAGADYYVAIYDLVIGLIFGAGAVAAYRIRDYKLLDRISWSMLIIVIPALFYLRYSATLGTGRSDYMSIASFLDLIIVFGIYAVLSLSPLMKLASSALYIAGVVMMYSSQIELFPGQWQGLVAVLLGYIFVSLIGFGNVTLIAKSRFLAFQSLAHEKFLNSELTDALDRVKTLSGMLPICANCKKVRDDQGYWEQIEHYITEHSEAEFTHGICPDCARELYPEIDFSDS
ncbi:MAG: hypothetical protein IID15_08100 [Candidatus Marinimicrobia bacterium]|nr:hypothetical protein [Candidatus Neomarinimicrobiota bacterium]